MSRQDKLKLFGLILTAICCHAPAFAECDSTIGATDKVADVKAKLACFSAENLQLRREIDELRGASARSPRVRIMSRPSSADLTTFTTEKCKDRAVTVVSQRGGQIVEDGDNWIAFQFGEQALSLNCDVSGKNAVLIVAGPDQKKNSDTSVLLGALIFPD